LLSGAAIILGVSVAVLGPKRGTDRISKPSTVAQTGDP
jgi:hypothetical protein